MACELYRKPFKLSENRIAYLIKGRSLIDIFYGHEPRKNCTQSQAWIASTVYTALDNNKKVGLSRLTPEFGGVVFRDLLNKFPVELLGEHHVQRWGQNTEVLLKLLNSDDCLLVQTHPNKKKAARYFHSPFGKTDVAKKYQLIGYHNTPCFCMNLNMLMKGNRYAKGNHTFTVALVEKSCSAILKNGVR